MSNFGWLKPGLTGAVAGAIGLAAVGFTWGGWVTGSTAQEMATTQGRVAMVNALVPICVANSKDENPTAAKTLSEIKDARTYQRADIVMKAGWATPPGSESADRDLAKACAEKLAVAS